MRALCRNCGCLDVVGDRDVADSAALAWRFAGSRGIPALTRAGDRVFAGKASFHWVPELVAGADGRYELLRRRPSVRTTTDRRSFVVCAGAAVLEGRVLLADQLTRMAHLQGFSKRGKPQAFRRVLPECCCPSAARGHADRAYSANTKCLFAGTSKDGSDGTRTRDLRRDRPVRHNRLQQAFPHRANRLRPAATGYRPAEPV